MSFLPVVVFVLIFLCFVFLLRLYVVIKTGSKYKPGSKGSVVVLAVAGSGGHTTELLRLMDSLSPSYKPRHYVIADTDKISEEKICTFESSKELRASEPQFTICRVPRSREVHQSWSSSVISTLHALLYSVPLVYKLRPDLVLCNGPGTCVPLCAAGLLLGILGMKKVLIVYVESICRVDSLSVTGRILYPVSDYFFVQWATLRDKYPKAIYLAG
ncbi:UDP-N-acetylglucosamine transferase subunit ALG14 homolog [Sphaeramia orbicularis]|uniref:UDP-N-acetylglucosamine transferase subunit ALG14 homolog n=1 Tax=Sphaeramia orbicularis TaxID=375764 RepID=UPI00117DE2E9|nr:UDP-N-acetylglucosamine transferase subunit ALG14 homolog [Sphaeramia orbicularis]